MKKCPFCEGEISNTAKKCKHCGERLSKEKETPEKPKNKIQTFLSEYGIFLAIGILILFFYLKPEKTQIRDIERDQESNTQNNNLEYDNGEYELVGDSKDIIISKDKKGFTLFPNKIGECNINGDDEIKNFVDAIRKAKDGEIINWTCQNQNRNLYEKNNNHIAFLFDNSYSEDLNGNIDKDGPNQRMANIGSYLTNKEFGDGTSLDFIFMFTVQPNDNSEEPDSNLYHFTIDTSKFTTIYTKKGKSEPFYDDKRKTLIYRSDVQLSTALSGGNQSSKCIEKSNYDYVCYDAESTYQKIQDIYSKNYDKESKHTNNMFMKTLAMNKNWFSGGGKDEIFIFTNGEFKIGYERETMYLSNLKGKYKKEWKHDNGADKTHNLTDFNMRYANRYQKDSKYESFWSDAIDVLRPQIPICEGVKIHVIGLTRSTEFKPLAEMIYKKIFTPCEVLFQ